MSGINNRPKNNLLRRLVDRVSPARCVLCGVMQHGAYFCPGCRCDLPWNNTPCQICAEPLPSAAGVQVCVRCRNKAPAFGKVIAPLQYLFPVDAMLKRLKFRACLYYAPPLASLLLPYLEREFPDTDALVPVPLYRQRWAGRGFNQALELTRPLAKSRGLPILHCVERCLDTAPQSGLNAAQRRANIDGAFALRGSLCCKNPVVVDDVITTGATVQALAKVLRLGGAQQVGVLSVARALTPGR